MNLTLRISISHLLIASKCIIQKFLYCMSYNSTATLQLFQKYHPSMTHQALHFIPSPCREMNERLCLGTIHHILQDEIQMFTMHPFPLTTQRTYHHLYEIITNAVREISNYHFILLCVRRWTRANDVNLSITQRSNFSRWQNNHLPPICLSC